MASVSPLPLLQAHAPSSRPPHTAHCWPSPSTGSWHVWPHLPGQHLVAPGQSASPAQWEQEVFLWHELQSWSRELSTSEMW